MKWKQQFVEIPTQTSLDCRPQSKMLNADFVEVTAWCLLLADKLITKGRYSLPSVISAGSYVGSYKEYLRVGLWRGTCCT